MLEHAAQFVEAGVPFIFDPGQGLPMFDGPELTALLDGAAVYVVNDYEWSLTLEKTGLDEDAIAERVGALIVTRGAEGSIQRAWWSTCLKASPTCSNVFPPSWVTCIQVSME